MSAFNGKPFPALTPLQDRFFKKWCSAGGSHAPYDDMITGPFADSAISVICENDVGWRYDHVGDRHDENNGVKLAGEIVKVLPCCEVEGRLDLYNSIVDQAQPVIIEEIGIMGLSRRKWTSRLNLPVKPPAGATAAVVGICEWNDCCSVLELDLLRDIVRRVCPAWLADLFHEQLPDTLQTRAKVLKMVAMGDFGPISQADQATISLVTTQLKSFVALDVKPVGQPC